VLNAANEVAVEAFLTGQIGFLEIAGTIRTTLEACRPAPLNHIDDVLKADRWGRHYARRLIDGTH
ncbi:MAG: 1-deoxy-D-xylulose-5-phosphate reductoisomerase, partial [Trichloromonadaceae bacterium]